MASKMKPYTPSKICKCGTVPEMTGYELCANPEFPTHPEQLWEKKTFSDGSVTWEIYVGGIAFGGHMDSRAGILIESK